MFASRLVTGLSFLVVVLDRLFFIWETKKVIAGCVEKVVILYGNDCIGIGLVDSALVLLDEWLFYRGGCLNMFECNALKLVSASFYQIFTFSPNDSS